MSLTPTRFTRPPWAVRHPLVLPLAMLAGLALAVLVYQPSTTSWWTIHQTILWVGAAIVIAVYLVVQQEAWRLLWGARTVENIERDIHDHVRGLELRVERMERTEEMQAALARLQARGG